MLTSEPSTLLALNKDTLSLRTKHMGYDWLNKLLGRPPTVGTTWQHFLGIAKSPRASVLIVTTRSTDSKIGTS